MYLNIIIQEAVSRKFARIDYPAKQPFFVYEKGKTDVRDHSVNWTMFTGDFKGEWVAGIGAYYLFDTTRRISLVLTKGISSPENSPPEGLKLTKLQKMDVDAFSDQWLEPVQLFFFQP